MTAMPPTKLRSALLLRFGGIISAAISMILCRTPPACPLFGTIASLRFASKALPFSAAIKQYFHTVQNQPAGRISRSAGPVHSPLRKLLHTLLQKLFYSLLRKLFHSLLRKLFYSLLQKSSASARKIISLPPCWPYAGAAALRAEHKSLLSAVLFDTAGQSCILIGALCLFAACKLSRLFVFQSSAKLCGSMGILPCAEGM